MDADALYRLVAEAREGAAQTDCPEHGSGQPPLWCGPCHADRYVAGDADAVRRAEALKAMARCDREFPRRWSSAAVDHPDVAAWVDQVCADPGAGRWLLLMGAVGRGKALLDSEGIATPNGPRAIGSLRVGDVVFGGDGIPCRVAGVYPQGIRPLWRLRLRDGRSVVCDADHLWVVTTTTERDRGAPPKVRSLAEMMDIGINYANGNPRWYISTPPPSMFPSTDLPLDPYTLGVLLGDGGLTGKTPVVTSADAEIIDALVVPAGITKHAYPRYRNSEALSWSLAGRRPHVNPVTEVLRDLGLWGTRSSQRFIPDRYLHATIESRLAVLAGLVDTDGWVSGPRVVISTSSPRLAADVERLVRSLGGSANSFSKATTHLPSWQVNVSLPARFECPARLLRKKAQWTPRRDRRGGTVAVVSVERVPDGPATCIAVTSPDSTFLTADYVVTHNSWQAYGAVRAVVAQLPGLDWAAVTLAGFAASLRPNSGVDGEAEMSRCAKAGLLFVDDIGAEKGSSWVEEVVYRLVNARYEAMLPTIFATNLPPDTLRSALGDRVTSRMAEMCVHVVLDGPDRRRSV